MLIFAQNFIAPTVRRKGWKSLCEVGACRGETSDELLRLPIDRYVIVDPCLDMDLAAKYVADSRVSVVKLNSLDALGSAVELRDRCSFDCILLDGDHNWYTVINELRLIHDHELLRPGGCIFFHDVAWPYARRDMYYQPESIPAEFLKPYAAKGIIQGQNALAEEAGVSASLCNAIEEGGPRNGVLTAIEDFLADHPGSYRFCITDFQFGLGILLRTSDNRWTINSDFVRFWTKTAAYSARERIRKLMPRSLKRALKAMSGH